MNDDMDKVELPSWMGRKPQGEFYRGDAMRNAAAAKAAQYSELADEVIERIRAVPAVDREHVKGVRLIRDRLNAHLAELADYDRSGVTG